MIAANGGHNGDEEGRESFVPAPSGNGGLYGGHAPNVAMNDLRVRDNARRVGKLVDAGLVAAEDLAATAKKIQERISGDCSDRDLVALGTLQLKIAQAPDTQPVPQQHLHLHGGGNSEAQPQKAVEYDPDYAEFLRQRALETDLHAGVVR